MDAVECMTILLVLLSSSESSCCINSGPSERLAVLYVRLPRSALPQLKPEVIEFRSSATDGRLSRDLF